MRQDDLCAWGRGSGTTVFVGEHGCRARRRQVSVRQTCLLLTLWLCLGGPREVLLKCGPRRRSRLHNYPLPDTGEDRDTKKGGGTGPCLETGLTTGRSCLQQWLPRKSTQVRRVTREQPGIAICSTRGRPADSHWPDLCSNGMGK